MSFWKSKNALLWFPSFHVASTMTHRYKTRRNKLILAWEIIMGSINMPVIQEFVQDRRQSE